MLGAVPLLIMRSAVRLALLRVVQVMVSFVWLPRSGPEVGEQRQGFELLPYMLADEPFLRCVLCPNITPRPLDGLFVCRPYYVTRPYAPAPPGPTRNTFIARAERLSGLRRSLLVDAPSSAAGHKEIKKDKAEENCQLAAVESGKEASRAVRVEIGDRHVAGEDECDRSGEEADQNKDASHQLENPLETQQREQRWTGVRRRRKTQELLGPVLQEQKARHDAQHRQHAR